MYYINKTKQNEIARRLKITPIMVSRYLKEAEQKGIVSFHVKMPWPIDVQLSKSVMDKYDIQECFALDVPDDSNCAGILGSFLADYFVQILPTEAIVGLSWGYTISRFVEALPYMNAGCRLLQLTGAFSVKQPLLTPSALINELSKKLDGQIYTLNAPLYASSEEMRDQLVGDPTNLMIRKLAEDSDINIFGASILEDQATTLLAGTIDNDDFNELSSLGAVGDLAGTFFNADGEELAWSKSKMYTGVPLDVIQKGKNVICVAGERKKTPIIRIACERGYVNTLVTTTQTAAELLKPQDIGKQPL